MTSLALARFSIESGCRRKHARRTPFLFLQIGPLNESFGEKRLGTSDPWAAAIDNFVIGDLGRLSVLGQQAIMAMQ